jgi:prevent-host-death family protein
MMNQDSDHPRAVDARCITGDTLPEVSEVSIRELRNHGGDVINRVVAGERVTVTRDGRAVAELRPLGRPAVPTRELKRRWSRLPALDPEAFRRDIDSVIDSSL